MITKVYSILDVKGDLYNVPFFAPTNGIALRQFTDLVNDKNSVPGRHPADFKLVQVGEFDDQSGQLIPCEMVSLGFGSEYQKGTP